MPWGTLDARGVARGTSVAARTRVDGRRVPGAPHRRRRARRRCARSSRRARRSISIASRRASRSTRWSTSSSARAWRWSCGGGTEIRYDPDAVILDADAGAAAAAARRRARRCASSASARRCRSRCCARPGTRRGTRSRARCSGASSRTRRRTACSASRSSTGPAIASTESDRAHLGTMADLGIDFLYRPVGRPREAPEGRAARRRRPAVDADRRLPRARVPLARARRARAAPRAQNPRSRADRSVAPHRADRVIERAWRALAPEPPLVLALLRIALAVIVLASPERRIATES